MLFKNNDAVFIKLTDPDGNTHPVDCDNVGNNFVDSCIGGCVVGAGIFLGHLVIKGCRAFSNWLESKKS